MTQHSWLEFDRECSLKFKGLGLWFGPWLFIFVGYWLFLFIFNVNSERRKNYCIDWNSFY